VCGASRGRPGLSAVVAAVDRRPGVRMETGSGSIADDADFAEFADEWLKRPLTRFPCRRYVRQLSQAL
jgi:hypothetical protein